VVKFLRAMGFKKLSINRSSVNEKDCAVLRAKALRFHLQSSAYLLISKTVISGRLKKRMGMCVMPIPRFTYILALPVLKRPFMKDDFLADLEFSIRKGIPIWPPCV
jgi:hypothetical protein